MKNISESSLVVLLNRMLAENKIIRVSYGKYKSNEDLKYDFLYKPSEFMLSLNRHIKEKFPFIDYCIWQPSIFASMMLHVPAVRTTLVDVEREAMESVFMALQSIESAIPVFLNPNKEDADRYITNRDMIIVRPLVKEAPIPSPSHPQFHKLKEPEKPQPIDEPKPKIFFGRIFKKKK